MKKNTLKTVFLLSLLGIAAAMSSSYARYPLTCYLKSCTLNGAAGVCCLSGKSAIVCDPCGGFDPQP